MTNDNALEIATLIRRNSLAYHKGDITYAQFDRVAKMLWAEAKRTDDVEEIRAILDQHPVDVIPLAPR